MELREEALGYPILFSRSVHFHHSFSHDLHTLHIILHPILSQPIHNNNITRLDNNPRLVTLIKHHHEKITNNKFTSSLLLSALIYYRSMCHSIFFLFRRLSTL